AADETQLLLWCRYARAGKAARGTDERRSNARLYQCRQPGLHFHRGPLPGARRGARQCAAAALRRLLHRRISDEPDRSYGEEWRRQPVAGGEPLANTQAPAVSAQDTIGSCQRIALRLPV